MVRDGMVWYGMVRCGNSVPRWKDGEEKERCMLAAVLILALWRRKARRLYSALANPRTLGVQERTGV